jgi:hypothetical protein
MDYLFVLTKVKSKRDSSVSSQKNINKINYPEYHSSSEKQSFILKGSGANVQFKGSTKYE